MRFFEDVRNAAPVDVGPLVVSAEQLSAYVELTGERHELHGADQIVPMSLLHARTAGALIDAEGDLAVVALRSATWRCVAPVFAGTEFMVRSQVVSAEEVTDDVGVVELLRSIRSLEGDILARSRVNLAVRRSPRA